MPPDRLEVGALIDLSQILPGLGELASASEAATGAMQEGFSAVSAQTSSIFTLQSQLARLNAEIRITEEAITDEAGELSAEQSILDRYNQELIAQTALENQLAQAKRSRAAAIREVVASQQEEQSPAVATQAVSAAPVVAAGAAERDATAQNVAFAGEEEISFNEAAQGALTLTARLYENSAAVREAATQVATLTGAQRQLRQALAETAEAEAAGQNVTADRAQQEAALTIVTSQRVAALEALKDAQNEAYFSQESASAAAAQAELANTTAVQENAAAITTQSAAVAQNVEAVHQSAEALLADYVARNQEVAATEAGMAALTEYAAATAALTNLRRESIAAGGADAAQEEILAAARARQTVAMQAVNAISTELTRQKNESAQASNAVSEAEMRVAQATVQNYEAQQALRSVLSFVNAGAQQNSATMNALAVAQREARAASMELTEAQEGLTVANDAVAVSSDVVEASSGRMANAYMGARLAGAVASDSAMMLGRSLFYVAAESSILAPILSALFPVLLFVGVLEVIGQIVDHFEKMHEKALDLQNDWNKLDSNFATFDRNLQSKIDEEQVKITGYTSGPLATLDEKIKLITFDVDTFNSHLSSTFDQFSKNVEAAGNTGFWHGVENFFGFAAASEQEVIEKAKGVRNAIDDAGDSIEDKHRVINRAIEDINSRLAAVNAQYQKDLLRSKTEFGPTGAPPPPQSIKPLVDDYTKLNAYLVQMNTELDKGVELEQAQKDAAHAEINKELETRSVANVRAGIEARKRLGDEEASAMREGAQKAFTAGQISLDEEANQLIAAENKKIQVERDYLAQREALLSRQAKLGENVTPERESLTAERTVEEEKHKSALQAINADETAAGKALADEALNWGIAQNAKEAEQRQKSAEQTTFAIAQMNVHNAEEGLKLHESTAIAGVNIEEQAASQQVRLEQMKLSASLLTGTAKAQISARLEEEDLEHTKRLEEEKLDIQRDAILRQQALLRGGQRPDQFLASAGPDALTKYQELNRQLDVLQQQRAARVQQIDNQIQSTEQRAALVVQEAWQHAMGQFNSSLIRSFDSVLSGTQRLSQAFREFGIGLEKDAINSATNWALKWAEKILLVEVLEKSSIGRRLVSLVTGEATKHAVEATSNEATVLGDAGLAAAAGFASVMEALPFPINVATAPGVAAAAAAGTIAAGATASAAQGGVLDRDGPIFAHAREMILPPAISTGLQGVISGGRLNTGTPSGSTSTSSSSSSRHQQFNIEVHNHGSAPQMSRDSVLDIVRTAVRRGELS